MIACHVARRRMPELFRTDLGEPARLEVEQHLQACAPCRQARAQWSLIGALQRPSQTLTSAAEKRIVANLIAAAGQAPAPSLRPVRRRKLPLFAAAAALLVCAWLGHRQWQPRTIVEGATIEAAAPGRIEMGGARIGYSASAKLELHPAQRTVILAHGEIDVDVTPGLPGRFRVATPHFIVEVLGTHFIVAQDGVRTLHGKVRVLDLQSRELAVVSAGQAWTMPTAPVAVASPPPAPVAAKTSAPAPRPILRAEHGPAAHDLLVEAKHALSQGDVDDGRALVDRALERSPDAAGRALASLLLADAYLVEKNPDEAIVAYRRVLRQHRGSPEAEVASFAVGQLLCERGRQAEAAAALNDYLTRYPMGRFVREARERLAQAHAAE